MLCQNCHLRTATVRLTRIINNKKAEIYLCEECAKKNKDFNVFTPLSINELLASLIDMEKPSMHINAESDLKCKTCGTTYSTFKKSGMLGCSDCYKSFERQLKPLIKRIHAGIEHTGKVPERSGINIKMKKKIISLREQLKVAIDKEEFERAAELRDKIKELEQNVNSEVK